MSETSYPVGAALGAVPYFGSDLVVGKLNSDQPEKATLFDTIERSGAGFLAQLLGAGAGYLGTRHFTGDTKSQILGALMGASGMGAASGLVNTYMKNKQAPLSPSDRRTRDRQARILLPLGAGISPLGTSAFLKAYDPEMTDATITRRALPLMALKGIPIAGKPLAAIAGHYTLGPHLNQALQDQPSTTSVDSMDRLTAQRVLLGSLGGAQGALKQASSGKQHRTMGPADRGIIGLYLTDGLLKKSDVSNDILNWLHAHPQAAEGIARAGAGGIAGGGAGLLGGGLMGHPIKGTLLGALLGAGGGYMAPEIQKLLEGHGADPNMSHMPSDHQGGERFAPPDAAGMREMSGQQFEMPQIQNPLPQFTPSMRDLARERMPLSGQADQSGAPMNVPWAGDAGAGHDALNTAKHNMHDPGHLAGHSSHFPYMQFD